MIKTDLLVFDGMNTSAQVGDIVYYSNNIANAGGFDKSQISETVKFGSIIAISGNSITVKYDDSIVSPPTGPAFISFVKDKKINTTSLLGYYAEVKFVNNSKDKVELFSVGSEIVESSK